MASLRLFSLSKSLSPVQTLRKGLQSSFVRANHTDADSNDSTLIPVTMIPGDGIGPEISQSVYKIFKVANVPIDWEEVSVVPIHDANTGKLVLPPEVISSILRTKIGLKGPLATPIGAGHISLNLTLRK